MKIIIPILFLFYAINAFSAEPQPILLISFDGFRWDYPEKTETPNLDYLIQNGVRAKSLIPSFPTKTFPNHYSIVTGLYPENHGIVANNMFDGKLNKWFKLSAREQVQNPAWWGGEPIWVTVEKAGYPTAPFFWPGSETKIKDTSPTYWQPYDHLIPYEKLIEQTLALLNKSDNERPLFLSLYFSLTDDIGHRFGPDSEEITWAIAKADSLIGQITNGLRDMQLLNKINLIIVSDHGMSATSSERLIFLDDYIDLSKINVIDIDPYAAINPGVLGTDTIYEKLSGVHSNFKIYRKEDIPLRFHYNNNNRIPALILMPDDGWKITTRLRISSSHEGQFVGGSHGYDNTFKSMGGIFIAYGPAFKNGLTFPQFANIHIYELMMHILGLTPAANDGNFAEIKDMLK